MQDSPVPYARLVEALFAQLERTHSASKAGERPLYIRQWQIVDRMRGQMRTRFC